MVPKLPRDLINRPRPGDHYLLERARECIAEAKAALALPRPSTFLGPRQETALDKSESHE
jgi:hypothetical protein